MRSVTSALARTRARGVEMMTQSVLRIPFSSASALPISMNSSGCSSARQGSEGVPCLARRPDLVHGARLLLVERILDRRLVWLVVRRERAVHEAGGRIQPATAIAFHDKSGGARQRVQPDAVRLGFGVRRFGGAEIGNIVPHPLAARRRDTSLRVGRVD